MVNELMPRIKRLAYKIWSRGARKSLEADDLVQAAVIRVLRAQSTFDPERAKWSTYALHHAFGGMRDEIRRYDHVPRLERARAKKEGRKIQEVVQLDLAPLDELPMLRPDPRSPAPAEIAAGNDFWTHLRKLLGDRDGRILEAYYRRDITLEEIGYELGLSQSRICQLLARAQEQLRLRWRTE